MSSWKNASKANQRTHRERHQPESRQHLGILEKKKDYQKRAKDFQEKAATLKLLRNRALSRNPDEFYHHMINSKIKDGVHHEKPKELTEEDTTEQAKLMNSQDTKYINLKRTSEGRKLERLQSELHFLDVANETPNTHMFFADSKKEAKEMQRNLAARLNTHPKLLARRINRPKLEDLQKKSFLTDTVTPEAINTRDSKYKELANRVHREKELSIVEQKLYIKKQLANKKQDKPKLKKAASKNAPPVYQWKYERKR